MRFLFISKMAVHCTKRNCNAQGKIMGTNNKSASQDATAILLPAGALEGDSDATLKTNGLVVQRHVVARDHRSTKN